jgi:hypothetical protein
MGSSNWETRVANMIGCFAVVLAVLLLRYQSQEGWSQATWVYSRFHVDLAIIELPQAFPLFILGKPPILSAGVPAAAAVWLVLPLFLARHPLALIGHMLFILACLAISIPHGIFLLGPLQPA